MTALLLSLTLISQCFSQEYIPEPVQGTLDSDSALNQMHTEWQERLRQDPEFAQTVALRLQHSKIASRITSAPQGDYQLNDILQWMSANPEEAAALAVGLAQDDAAGTNDFETMVTSLVKTRFVDNPQAKHGIFGRLKSSSGQSTLLKHVAEDMSEEERREIVKNLFEGQGTSSSKVIKSEKPSDAKPGSPSGPGSSQTSAPLSYDRLSQSNLRGYSPQVQTLQSSLNQRWVPGAPKLIETGKLDYATLVHPSHAMRFDIRNLVLRLRYEKNLALSSLLGKSNSLTPQQLIDPSLEASLLAQIEKLNLKLNPQFSKREKALEAALAALADFELTAKASQDPDNISPVLLKSLGRKQKEVARWLTIAALEEELQRLSSELSFLNPALLELISRAPLDDQSRAAYINRGAVLMSKAQKLNSGGKMAIAGLLQSDWLLKIDSLGTQVEENGRLRKNLSRDIRNYQIPPYRLAQLSAPQARWKVWREAFFVRYLPWTDRAKLVGQRNRLSDQYKDVFLQIAQGQLDAAHTILSAISAD